MKSINGKPVKQSDAIKAISAQIIEYNLRHTDGDVLHMIVDYYNARQNKPTRRDFSRAIDKIQKAVVNAG